MTTRDTSAKEVFVARTAVVKIVRLLNWISWPETTQMDVKCQLTTMYQDYQGINFAYRVKVL